MNKYLMIATLVLLQACSNGRNFYVDVDAINRPMALSKTKYTLVPGIKDVEEGNLQYQEYASYVEQALESQGYKKAQNVELADVKIYLGYGVSEPEARQYIYSVPTYGEKDKNAEGVYFASTMKAVDKDGSSFTYTDITTSPTTTGYVPVDVYGATIGGAIDKYGNTSTHTSISSSFTNAQGSPPFGATGSKTCIKRETVYHSYMWLEAVDMDVYRQTGKKVQLWKTSATSTSSCGDLREIFPVLVVALEIYIGSNTGKKIQVSLSEGDVKLSTYGRHM